VKRLWQLSTMIASVRLLWWTYVYYTDFYHLAIPAYGPVDVAMNQIYVSRGHHLIIGAIWSVILLSSLGMLLCTRIRGSSLGKPHQRSRSGCSSM
jgi:hypothetical protein